MKFVIGWVSLIAFSLVTGCAVVQSGGEVVRGRAALLAGQPKECLANFRRAAQLDPDYVPGLRFSKKEWGVFGAGKL
jgi:hypothetical protein